MTQQDSKKYTTLICAAGQGKRLMPMTADRPKTLVEVNRKPIIEYMLDNCSEIGLTDVIILVGYKGDAIEEKYGDVYKNCNLRYIYNKDYETTDNFYSIFLAKEHVHEGMIFMNADIIFHKHVLESLLSNDYQSGLAVVDVDSPGAGKNPVRVKLDAQGKIIDIGHNIGDENKKMVFGIYKLSKNATAKYFEDAEKYFRSGPQKGGFWLPIRNVVSNENFYSIPVSNKSWVSINNIEEHKTASALVDSILHNI